MRAIILGLSLYDYKAELKPSDLVHIDEGYDSFYNIVEVNPRYNKKPNEPDTKAKYFVRSKLNNELMNFERSELSKANIMLYDADIYENQNQRKVMVGQISPNDMNFIKAKYANEWNMGRSEFDKITTSDLIELIFEGDMEIKTITGYDPLQEPTKIRAFKLHKPETI